MRDEPPGLNRRAFTGVAVLGAGELLRTWTAALSAQGAAPETADATGATLAGLNDAWRRSQ